MDNNELKSQVLANFKTLNNITVDTYDNIFNLYIDKAIQEILNLTNRINFPIALRYVILDMVNDFYTIYKSNFNISSETEESSSNNDTYIKSLSEAGRSISFESASELILNSLLSSHITQQLENRQKQIYRYRLLYREMSGKEDIIE